MQTADCRLADYISCLFFNTYTNIYYLLKTGSLDNAMREFSLA